MKIVLFIFAVSVLAAQPHARPPAQAPAHRRSVQQAGLSDAQIQSNIQAKLAKSKIGKNGFKFTTLNGVTTIEGKANVIQHKGAATRLAQTAGSRAVINKIQISEEARAAARAKLKSGRRRVQVKRGDTRTQPR